MLDKTVPHSVCLVIVSFSISVWSDLTLPPSHPPTLSSQSKYCHRLLILTVICNTGNNCSRQFKVVRANVTGSSLQRSSALQSSDPLFIWLSWQLATVSKTYCLRLQYITILICVGLYFVVKRFLCLVYENHACHHFCVCELFWDNVRLCPHILLACYSLARMIYVHVHVQIHCAVGEVCATLFVLVLCQLFHILCIHSSIPILRDVQVVCTVSEHWLLCACTLIWSSMQPYFSCKCRSSERC